MAKSRIRQILVFSIFVAVVYFLVLQQEEITSKETRVSCVYINAHTIKDW